MARSVTRPHIVAAFAMVLASPALGQATMPTYHPPQDGAGVANGSFQQRDFDVIKANGQVRDAQLLTGDRYALRPTLDYVSGFAETFVSADKLLDLRRKRLDNLIDRNRRDLDRDGDGQPIVRDRVLLLDPTAPNLAAAVKMGFQVAEDQVETALGLRLVSLTAPRGQSALAAAAALNAAVPGIGAELDPIYEPAGEALAPLAAAGALAFQGATAASSPVSIVMIDGGIAEHPALKDSGIEQKGFVGKVVPTAHGTAIASLLVGNQGPFRGAALGARLYAADIYSGNAAKGSASAMFRALGWAASKKPTLVSISLVGARSTAVERALAALQKSGTKVVAAVGNDGALAPMAFPASYSGVISVTGTDRGAAALMEAGRAGHVDFAAPGADLVAAVPGRGYMAVRGTSFAVPLVVGRIAHAGSIVRLAREASPGKGEVGLGVLCAACGLSPSALGKAK